MQSKAVFKIEHIENKVMRACPNSILAFGDFNTIPGKISKAISAISNDFEFQFGAVTHTFFGSYCDMVPINPDEIWEPLVEQ